MGNTILTEVAIIGGGPAGLAAALYLGRAQVDTLVIDKDMCGGQIISSPLLENVPGFYGSGAELAISLLNEVEKYPSVIFEMFNKVVEVHPSYSYDVEEGYVLILEDGQKVCCKYLICATGSTPIHLKGIDGPNVHYCVTCDGALYEDKVAAIIGGGNSALQYALELETYADVVIVVTNEEDIRGEEIMRERVRNSEKIEVITNFTATSFEDGYLKSNDHAIKVDGVFVAVGYKTETEYFNVAKDNGRFITDQHFCIYNGDFYFNNSFAIGDCRKKPFNQVVIAMGEGCQVALQIIRNLEK